MTAVVIQGKLVDDARSFRSVFAEPSGSPDFHGGVFDACIDCTGYLGEPGAGMSRVHVESGTRSTLHVLDSDVVAA
jgi:hypothetical protein